MDGCLFHGQRLFCCMAVRCGTLQVAKRNSNKIIFEQSPCLLTWQVSRFLLAAVSKVDSICTLRQVKNSSYIPPAFPPKSSLYGAYSLAFLYSTIYCDINPYRSNFELHCPVSFVVPGPCRAQVDVLFCDVFTLFFLNSCLIVAALFFLEEQTFSGKLIWKRLLKFTKIIWTAKC